jgi:hypothetical protein
MKVARQFITSVGACRRADGCDGTMGERIGDAAIATKWLNRVALGFSPGYGHQLRCALKGRPNTFLEESMARRKSRI